MPIIEIRSYTSEKGINYFERWYLKLTREEAAQVDVAQERLSAGNFSRVEGVGQGVYECKIHFGPGLRVYFGRDGDQLIVLVGGGAKKRQSSEIENAVAVWKEYKSRKSERAKQDARRKSPTEGKNKGG